MLKNYSETNSILAVITKKENRDIVFGGGAPIFLVENNQRLEELSMLIARITLGMVHDLGNNIKIIVKH